MSERGPRAARRLRIASALLAALVLWASLAATAHAHAILERGRLLAAAPLHDRTSAIDLDCALCAAKVRLSQGELQRPSLPALSRLRPAPAVAPATTSRLAPPLAAPSSRAPPRQG